MRILRLVAVLMMPAVQGDPFQDGPLDGHRAEHSQDELHDPIGFKGSVREQPVVTDGNPQRGEDVHAKQNRQVDPVKAPAPNGNGGCHQADKGHDDCQQVDNPQAQRDASGRRVNRRQVGDGIRDRQDGQFR